MESPCPLSLVASLRSPPTSLSTARGKAVLALKTGELLSIDLETGGKVKLVKEKITVTAVAKANDIVIYGTRKGEIKAIIDGRIARIATRHASSIVEICATEDDSDVNVITSSADKKVMLWKLVISPQRIVSLVFIKALYGPNTAIISSRVSGDRRFVACTSELSNTIRVFKLEKDTQLLFKVRDGEHALHAEWIGAEEFVAASDSGALYLYSTEDAAPLQIVEQAPSAKSCTPTLLKRVGDNKVVVGYSNGQIALVEMDTNGRRKIEVRELGNCRGIPNSAEPVKGDNGEEEIVLAAGQEERHKRFIIEENAKNALWRIATSQSAESAAQPAGTAAHHR